MMSSRGARGYRRALGLAGLIASAGSAGCITKAGVPALGAIGGPMFTYAATAIPAGPRATFINDSSLALRVRYWIGRRDITAPGGVADIRTGDGLVFTAAPGEFFITQCGRPFWPTSMADAVVRVRVDPLPDDGTRQPIWLQLDQPQPYTWRAVGDSADTLSFERFGGGSLGPLPRDAWIDRDNGPFPVDTDLAAGRH